MYRNSTFFQILKHLDKGCVKKLATKHHSDKYYKRFNTWNYLATMVFAHLTNSKSLRDMEIGCSFIKSSQYHLQLSDVKRSILILIKNFPRTTVRNSGNPFAFDNHLTYYFCPNSFHSN
ncbi:DUF4372 domain-containing protein [Rickettsiales endosymbiont of Peranema trichophorum]|uniref:DUF4372 domain-containing protein n=1 Tax=Rickettsiales endosymbiont of Peranema trichophorum TaxID=2486577 RepID=UPI003979F476